MDVNETIDRTFRTIIRAKAAGALKEIDSGKRECPPEIRIILEAIVNEDIVIELEECVDNYIDILGFTNRIEEFLEDVYSATRSKPPRGSSYNITNAVLCLLFDNDTPVANPIEDPYRCPKCGKIGKLDRVLQIKTGETIQVTAQCCKCDHSWLIDYIVHKIDTKLPNSENIKKSASKSRGPRGVKVHEHDPDSEFTGRPSTIHHETRRIPQTPQFVE